MKEQMYNPDINQLTRLHIELSSRCNASCGACSRNLSGGATIPGLQMEDLCITDIENMVPDHIAPNIDYINYCGNLGDPGMAPDLLKILQYFKSHNKNIIQQVRTNGGMRGSDFWHSVGEFYAQEPPEHTDDIFSIPGVVWSVDGLEDTNHLYRRGVKWDKVWANMEAYSKTGAKAVWEFLVFDHNEHQIEEARALCTDLGFHFAPKNPFGFGESQGKPKGLHLYDKEGVYDYSIFPAGYNQSRVVPEQTRTAVLRPDVIASSYKVPELSSYSSELAKTSTVKCRSIELGYNEIYISSTGHLLPCCFLGGTLGRPGGIEAGMYSRHQFIKELNSHGMDLIDLRKNSIEEIIYNEKFSGMFLNGWNAPSVEEGKLLFCVEMCGECSPIKKLYQNRDS